MRVMVGGFKPIADRQCMLVCKNIVMLKSFQPSWVRVSLSLVQGGDGAVFVYR